MTFNDLTLIGRKILVGIALTVLPGVILIGGLWLLRATLAR
jgi:hypothetical protein